MDAVGVAAEAGNALGGLYVMVLAGVYIFVENVVGGGAGLGALALGGDVVVYIAVAGSLDRKEGKLRSIRPNPLHIELQPRRSPPKGSS